MTSVAHLRPGSGRNIVSVFLLMCAFLSAAASFALTGPQFRRPQAGDPVVETILYGPSEARAWIRHNGERFHALAGTRLDNEWRVEEIRRESVLLKRTSTRTFVDMPVSLSKRPPFHKGWSLLGLPSGLWETLELLAAGFGHHVVMHHSAGATIAPCVHGTVLEQMLLKIMPRHHRFALTGPVLLVLPVDPGGESWTSVLKRLQEQRPEKLVESFRGLNKSGTLLSRGDDIQLVLRRISLGGETAIRFPENVHFPVYASFRNAPFSQMLTKIVYLNQCSIIVRTDHLEIAPPSGKVAAANVIPAAPLVSTPNFGPSEPAYDAPVIEQHPDGTLSPGVYPPPAAPGWQPLESPAISPFRPSAGTDSQ